MPRGLTLQEKHPELFTQDLYVDPGSRTRIIPMEVLCLGYMRTGTACGYLCLLAPIRRPTDSIPQQCRMP